jgi:hypothetical protein
MQNATTARDTFDALMAGGSVNELQTRLEKLPAQERRHFLCTSCCLHPEIDQNYPGRGRVLNEILASNCHFYASGPTDCTLKLMIIMSQLPEAS